VTFATKIFLWWVQVLCELYVPHLSDERKFEALMKRVNVPKEEIANLMGERHADGEGALEKDFQNKLRRRSLRQESFTVRMLARK